jgi:hypothetical protein
LGRDFLQGARHAVERGLEGRARSGKVHADNQATTFIGTNILAAEIDGPWNFVITDEGLRTPWGRDCGLMKGNISASKVSVACGDETDPTTVSFKVEIDRELGTFRWTTTGRSYGDPTVAIVSSKTGTCQKRATL